MLRYFCRILYTSYAFDKESLTVQLTAKQNICNRTRRRTSAFKPLACNLDMASLTQLSRQTVGLPSSCTVQVHQNASQLRPLWRKTNFNPRLLSASCLQSHLSVYNLHSFFSFVIFVDKDMLIFSVFSVRFKWSLNSSHLSDPALRCFSSYGNRRKDVTKVLQWDTYFA
jgi:hypothetical protein